MGRKLRAPFSVLALVLTAATGSVAAPPDAGSLLREELRRDQPAAPIMPPKVEAVPATPAATEAGSTMLINGFRFVGLRSFPESEAQAQLAPHAGKAHTLDDLHRIIEKFEQWLRLRGLMAARAYIPPHDMKDGIVEIRVIEGHVEGIDIKRTPDTRLSEQGLQAILASALPPGGALETQRLERGVLLMNDLPATSARAVLAPGKELGGSRVVVEAAQGTIPSGSAELDNTGNRFTGEWRLGAGVTLNDPYGIGDQWSLRASKSRSSDFVRGGYTVPLGSDGLKAGIAVIESTYRLCCEPTVDVLNSSGEASAISGFITYPLIRSRISNLALSLNVASRDFVNRSLGATTSDKKTSTTAIGINGDFSDQVGLAGQGAFTTYGFSWMSGNVNLDAWTADKTQDAATAGSQGRFEKWTAQLSHLVRLSDTAAVYGALSAQWARKNLDSSEKFGLGGPQGVRAYPSGEAGGDEGWMANLEWRQELGREFRLVGFIDYGEVKLHRTVWANWNAANPLLVNRYALAGAGATIAWTPASGRTLSATLATRMGKNPARDATGRDSDNRPAHVQFWLQGNIAF